MATEQQDRILAASLRRLELLDKQEAFDPIHLTSRPTLTQQEVIDEFGRIKQQWIRAGNQCLSEGTLIATPAGPTAIEHIQVGDTVYSEHGETIRVLATFQNGEKEVSDLTCRGVRWVSATDNHVFQVVTPYGHIEEKKVDSFSRDDQVRRIFVQAPLGTVRNTQAYVIGALLGDGCSRQPHRYIQISSGSPEVPNRVASILGNTARKLHESNYTWSVGYSEVLHYNEWCKGRYAHQKIADMNVIRSWDRTTLLEFIAGLIDTDGSIYPASDHVTLSLGMQAKSVIDAFEYAVLALWQVPMNRAIDNRTKYKNGPLHVCYTRNVHAVKRILNELDSYTVSPQKKWRDEYADVGGKRSNTDSIGLRSGFNRRIEKTYDIRVDSSTNLYLLANGLVTHNSGKSQTCARIVTWFVTDTHPSWKKPVEWADEPLLVIVAGRTGKQIEDSLLPKLRSYLEAGTYKEVRIGNMIQRLELTNGNRIIFQSLENPTVAQERLQSYVAHLTWTDELPPTMGIVRELLIRTQARNGYNIFSFTPTTINAEIQKYVDGLTLPEGRVYRFNMLDNPLYLDPARSMELVSRYAHLPGHVRNAIFNGDWMASDDQVYYFNYATMVEMPQGYAPTWRHVESVDPALKSALGLTVWAEDPNSTIWYCILAEYMRGILVPVDLVNAVREKTKNYNIVRRIADPHEVWYIQTAASMGIHYQGVYKKTERGGELIKGTQTALGTRARIAPHCSDLINEFQTQRYSDKVDGKIVNASSFHLIDSTKYFVDGMPKPDKKILSSSWDEWLLKSNQLRKEKEEKKNRKEEVSRIRRSNRGRRTFGRGAVK